MAIAERSIAAQSAAHHLAQHPLFQSAQQIACYIAYRDEFETQPLIQQIALAKKRCYLPILTGETTLQFIAYQTGDALMQNKYGIPEPVDQTKIMMPEKLDIVITPLVAFDSAGHRLGTGGGYYDKTFIFKRDNKTKKPVMLGLAYSIQEAALLPSDTWDVALDGVITENGVRLF